MAVSQVAMNVHYFAGFRQVCYFAIESWATPPRGCLRDVTELREEGRKSKTSEIEKQHGQCASVIVQIPNSLADPCQPKVSNNGWMQGLGSKSEIRKLDNAGGPSTVILRPASPSL